MLRIHHTLRNHIVKKPPNDPPKPFQTTRNDDFPPAFRENRRFYRRYVIRLQDTPVAIFCVLPFLLYWRALTLLSYF